MNDKPLIGITLRHDVERRRFYLAPEYAEAVAAQGGVPLYISLIPDKDYIAHIVAKLDGVLLPGSASDVDPAYYNQEPDVNLGGVHPLRDQTDLLILRAVEEKALPLLAICYGMQIWNVARGGTLIQDLASGLPNSIQHQQQGTRQRRSHKVEVAANSMLSDLAEHAGQVFVNSHHHQGIIELGAGLIPCAWTSDKLVEAFENEQGRGWGLGVQWHPEVDWENDKLSKRIFGSFIEAARQRQAERYKELVATA